MLRRLLLVPLLLGALFLATAAPASAHNSLESSTPKDGSTLSATPTSMTLRFAKDVPLDTLTVTLTDPVGARTVLTGSRHGTSPKLVVVLLPKLSVGTYSLRWRLVSADGHAITGRVGFSLSAASASTSPGPSTTTSTARTTTKAASPTTPTAPAALPETIPASNPDQTEPTDTTDTTVVAGTSDESDDVDAAEAGDDGLTTPSWIRWVLRYLAYVAILIVAGVLATESFVWKSAASEPTIRSIVAWSLAAIAASALLQLAILAGDIAGTAPWSALDRLGAAADTDVGIALIARIAIAAASWVLIIRARSTSPQVYLETVLLLALGMLATWSFAGHSRSLRWPWVGVPIDVAHHGAAAAWLGGLIIVHRFALPASSRHATVEVMQRFSRLSAWSVGAVVSTGLVQAVRLTGGLSNLFETDHGRLLLGKVALLGGMLWFAQRNRVAVRSRFRLEVLARSDVTAMRRALRNELVVGLGIIAVTAALVVSPPGAAL